MTRIIDKDISFAAECIRAGGLVSVPTETVYGLAANGLDADAVEIEQAFCQHSQRQHGEEQNEPEHGAHHGNHFAHKSVSSGKRFIYTEIMPWE